MRKQRRTGNSILRAVVVALSLLFQVGWMLLMALRLNEYSAWISLGTSILSLIIVLRLYNKHTTAAMKLPWIMLIMAFPVMGISLYLMIIAFGDLGSSGKRLKKIRRDIAPMVEQSPETLEALASSAGELSGLCRYLWQNNHSPVYENTSVRYFPWGAEAFEALKEELRRAESFIFMEYFIIRDVSSFQEIRDILVQKVRQGVEVRLMYDDVGSVGYVNLKYAKQLNDLGIQCRVFNPALPVLNLFLNHRDHRKITVIDGKVGFTGGYNLSDEYFDRTRPYGLWKDTGIRLEGEAVQGLTATFLELWNASDWKAEDYETYLGVQHSVKTDGFVQPFGDSPLGEERVMENVLLHLIFRAKKSLYVMTPYLIITEEMNRALGLAAKRGVDVRIITPGIPDKKTVFAMTRSYYAQLVSQGVRIYEYTPGFCHAKQCICDGEVVVIGTSNLDYRSLYLHFENNVLLFGSEAVGRIAQDFTATFAQCREVTEDYRTGRGKILLTWQYLLRLFSPMV